MRDQMSGSGGGRDPFLSVRGLNAWYGESHVLHGVDFDVHEGEVVTLLGRNGAGKTTTMKSIMGIVGKRQGSITFKGQETIGLPSNRIARLGLAFCPEERGIFSSLNVEENLTLPPVIAPGGLSLDTIFELFPNLKERLRSQGTNSFAEIEIFDGFRLAGESRETLSCASHQTRQFRLPHIGGERHQVSLGEPRLLAARLGICSPDKQQLNQRKNITVSRSGHNDIVPD
jgi:ABC-type branched-subunit amino acid transport system ATPase component